jgi:hypothetical protein
LEQEFINKHNKLLALAIWKYYTGGYALAVSRTGFFSYKKNLIKQCTGAL